MQFDSASVPQITKEQSRKPVGYECRKENKMFHESDRKKQTPSIFSFHAVDTVSKSVTDFSSSQSYSA